MLPKGNPAQIAGLADLGKPGVKLVMPNPAFEGIAARSRRRSPRRAATPWSKAVYEAKVADGDRRSSPTSIIASRRSI